MSFQELLSKAEAGDAMAQWSVGCLFENKAKYWLSKGMAKGVGSVGPCVNFEELLNEAEAGNAESQYQLGCLIEEVAKDWWGKAATSGGHEGAWEKLGFERDPFYDKMTEKYGKKNKDKKE